ncbi:MAG: ATP-binding protein [Bacteroidota bacterium]
MILQCRQYLENLDELSTEQMMAFQQNQSEFLVLMNNMVNMFENESNTKLQVIIIFEVMFALASLLFMFYEINFIFKPINRELKEKNASLKQSNQLLEQYAFLAAHELRSPTQNILNFTKVLRTRLEEKLDDQEKQFFHFIEQSGERLKNRTDDLLHFSTITHEEVRLEECEPIELVKEAVRELRTNISDKQARVRIGKLPTSIKADRQMLQLVFRNLISNGIKYVDQDKQPIVEIQYEQDNKQHIFLVADNGIGIANENKQKIFGLFKTVHSNDKLRSSGIGLSLCQKVIEKHRGNLSVDSQPAEGSTFRFTIPKQMVDLMPQSLKAKGGKAGRRHISNNFN